MRISSSDAPPKVRRCIAIVRLLTFGGFSTLSTHVVILSRSGALAWVRVEPGKSLFRMPMNRDAALLAAFLIGSVMSREKVAELNCLVSCFLIDPFRKRNAIQFIWRAGACACQWSQINIYSIDLL